MDQRKLLVSGSAAFSMVWLMCVVVTVPLIEKDLLERTHDEFDAVSLERAIVTFDGRRASLDGEVRLAEEITRAEEIVRGVRGVVAVTNELTVKQERVVPVTITQKVEPWLEIRFTAAGALVLGVVPGAEQKVRLVAAARSLVPSSGQVFDQLHIESEMENAALYDQAPMVVKLLSRTVDGAMRMDSTTLRLEGMVANDQERQTLIRLASAAAPGLVVDDLLSVGSGAEALTPDRRVRPPEGSTSLQTTRPIASDLQSSLNAELARQGVDFLPGTATYTANGQKTLNRVAGLLLNDPRTRLEVAGHTSASGSDREDRKLSFLRAKAVVDYLVGRGVGSSRLTAAGYGSRMQPQTESVGADRIEFHVTRED